MMVREENLNIAFVVAKFGGRNFFCTNVYYFSQPCMILVCVQVCLQKVLGGQTNDSRGLTFKGPLLLIEIRPKSAQKSPNNANCSWIN